MSGDHAGCRDIIVRIMADHGCEVTISTAAPIIETPYDPNPMTCPHGTTFYMAPTSEQIAQWASDGVR